MLGIPCISQKFQHAKSVTCLLVIVKNLAPPLVQSIPKSDCAKLDRHIKTNKKK